MSKVYLIVEMVKEDSTGGHGGGPGQITAILGGKNDLVGSYYLCPVKGKEYPAFTRKETAQKFLDSLEEDDCLFKWKKPRLQVYELSLI